MTYSAGELHAMMYEAVDLPDGAAQIAAIEHVARHAPNFMDERELFHVRRVLCRAYTEGGEPARALAPFAECPSRARRRSGRLPRLVE